MPLNIDTDGVRSALDLSLTSDDLPVATITRFIFTGPARAWVLQRDPDAETYEGGSAAGQHAQLAYTYALAAQIAPSLPRIVQERAASGSSVQYQKEQVDDLVARLYARASAELAAYLEENGYPALPGGFWVASGTRGR